MEELHKIQHKTLQDLIQHQVDKILDTDADGSNNSCYNINNKQLIKNICPKDIIIKISKCDSNHNNKEDITVSKPYTCDYCNYRSDRSYTLKRHLTIHESQKIFKCDLCDYTDRLLKNLKTHLLVSHSNRKIFCCRHCNYQSSRSGDVRRHEQNHCPALHPQMKPDQSAPKDYTGVFRCVKCDFQCELLEEFRAHRSIHEKYFSCNLCEYRVKRKSLYVQHMTKHNNGEVFKCDTPGCDYTCTQKALIKRHQLIHSGKYYSCDQCDYKTGKKSDIDRHSQIHSDKNLLGCDQCDFKCRQFNSLKSHFETHKVWRCDQCPYISDDMCKLDEHKVIHEEIYNCIQCDYRCDDEKLFKAHKLVHFGQQLFYCDRCNYTSNKQDYLESHKLTHEEVKYFSYGQPNGIKDDGIVYSLDSDEEQDFEVSIVDHLAIEY